MTEPEAVNYTPEGKAITDLILAVFRTNGRLLRAGDALSRDLGFTAARWQVMGAINSRPKTVAQIAREFELTRQGVLWVVRTMVKDGFLELIDNPDHRRAKLVRFTEYGSMAYRTISLRQARWVNEMGEVFRLADLHRTTELVCQLGLVVKEVYEADSDE